MSDVRDTEKQIEFLTIEPPETQQTRSRMESFLLDSADAIWMIDMNDRVLQINPAFEEIFGWSEEDTIGKMLPIVPEHLAEEWEQALQLIKQGNSMRGYETLRLCKDGCLIHVSATFSPVRNQDGEVVAISGSCRDITRIKRAEEELRKAKERLEAFMQNSADAIWMIDMNDRVLQINPAFETLFGWTEQDVLGKPLPIIPDFLAAEIAALHERIKTGELAAGYQTQRLRKDGRLIYVSATLSPVRNTAGDIVGISGTCRDITENKQAEELLIRSEKLSVAGQLAAGLAHEIRNPLTALKGFVQLMSMDESSSHNKYLTVMASELGRIEMIVSELLVLAKPQAHIFKRKPLLPILQDVLTLSETQAIMQNVQIEAKLHEEFLLDCDVNQLKQIFINFIKNAIEAMPSGGAILVEASRCEDDHVRIRVQDQGSGIPKEHLARIGEPFYTTKTKGTGLGLMVCKKIIDGHHGRLEIASEVGVGTTIDVYLPLSVEE